MPFLAPKGAIRCDIVTALSEPDVVDLAAHAMTHNSTLSKLFASPDTWEPCPPPSGAKAAFIRVLNKREQRLQSTSPGGMQAGVAALAAGTVVALGFESKSNGNLNAQLWTSSVNKHGSSGRIGAAIEVRKRMRRLAKALSERDPGAEVRQSEDGS